MIRIGGLRIYLGSDKNDRLPVLRWFGIGWRGDWFIGLMVRR